MDISSPPQPSTWAFLVSVVLFAATGMIALYFAVTAASDLLLSVNSGDDSIVYKKGSFYLFGIGVGMLVFISGPAYVKLFNGVVSSSAHKVLNILLIFSIVLTFLFPQLVQLGISTYLEENGYYVCEEKSRRWLHVVTIVYARNSSCKGE